MLNLTLAELQVTREALKELSERKRSKLLDAIFYEDNYDEYKLVQNEYATCVQAFAIIDTEYRLKSQSEREGNK